MEERLMDLEMKYMEQERALQELSDALYVQQRTIEGLERKVERIAARLGEVLASAAATADSDGGTDAGY